MEVGCGYVEEVPIDVMGGGGKGGGGGYKDVVITG